MRKKPIRLGAMLSAAMVFAGALVALGSVGTAPALAADPASTAAYGTPTIDGQADPIWDNSPAIDISASGAPITAVTKFMWDSKNLYVLTVVNDSTPVYGNSLEGTPDQGLSNDSVDIWINWTDKPTASYADVTGTTIDISRDDSVTTTFGGSPGTDLSAIQTKTTTTSTQYTVEAAIPWQATASRPGSPIGANTSINDTTTAGGTRADYITWDTVDTYWTAPGGMPTVTPQASGDNRIFEDTDTFDVPLGAVAYLPVWADDVSGTSYTASGSDVSVDSAAGTVTGLALGSGTVTAQHSGLADDTITVNVVIPPGPPGFTTSTFTDPNTSLKSGASVNYSIAGLWQKSTPTGFTDLGGSSWLSVSSSGVVTGTVPTPVPSVAGAIEIQGTDGTNTSTLNFLVPLPAPTGGHFLVSDFTTVPTSSTGTVQQSVAGLWSGPDAATFTKVSGDSWLNVSASGLVTGTAPKSSSSTGEITIQGSDGVAAGTVTVEVPVLAPGQLPAVTAASWNLWDNGSHVDGGLGKEVAAIAGSGLDVIGVQESDGSGAKSLADALGWYSYQSSGDLGIVSAYPISDVTAPTTATPAAGVTITVGSESLRVWTAHLDETTAATAATQAAAIATELAPDLAKSATAPVVLLGDLVSPTAAGAFTKAGLTDAGAAVKSTAPTFSLVASGGASTRADYVDYRGALSVLGAEAYYTGWPSATDVSSNAWPSDHAAAVAELQLRPTGKTAPTGPRQ